jgi:hypothetical protein
MYKCPSPGGSVTYSQTPCQGEKIEIHAAPAPEDKLSAAYRAIAKSIDNRKSEIAEHCKGKHFKSLEIGMRKEDAFCVSFSYAFPDSVNTTTVAGGVREQYVFSKYEPKAYYLYFTDGVLTAIQR